MDTARQLSHSQDVATKVAMVLRKRTTLAHEHFAERLRSAFDANVGALMGDPTAAARLWADWYDYAIDGAQRSILFLDTLRQRGNNFVEHVNAGQPPVLHFDYETVVDGRTLPRPVNYALVRIVPPEGVVVDPKRRPYMIIDPRAGHGPGIGGFKDDSQVGVALREGHPVYFVIFFRDPEPGQTLLDVCEAEKQFVHKVRELHPAQQEAGDRRQLPGRLGGDDARRRRSRRDGPDRHQRRADVVLGRRMAGRRRRQPDALLGRHARRHVARVADRRSGRRRVRRRVPGRELREPEPGEHVLGQVLPPVRERRHRAAALPRVRALVGRLLPDEPRRDRVDHPQPLRRQQAVDRRNEDEGRRRVRPAQRSRRRSSCSRRWATTSRRRSRRSTGSRTSTARPTRSRRAAR